MRDKTNKKKVKDYSYRVRLGKLGLTNRKKNEKERNWNFQNDQWNF